MNLTATIPAEHTCDYEKTSYSSQDGLVLYMCKHWAQCNKIAKVPPGEEPKATTGYLVSYP